jgi:hypothetical protein
MTGEVEERQGELAAEDSIETREGGESPAGQVEPEEEAQGQETNQPAREIPGKATCRIQNRANG